MAATTPAADVAASSDSNNSRSKQKGAEHSASAAMDIMMKLRGEALSAVYSDFKAVSDAEGRGLTLTEFVSSILRHLLEQQAAADGAPAAGPDLVALTRDLVDVFEQIDVNGDHSLEWEEFAAFAIEAGNASSGAGRATGFAFAHDHMYSDVITRTAISGCTYEPAVDALVVLEAGSKLVRLYTPSLILARTIDTSVAIRPSRREEDRSTPVATAVCSPKGEQPMLAVLLSGHVIGLWRLDDEETCPFFGVLPRPALTHSPVTLGWDPLRRRLYAGCTNGTLLGYDVLKKASVAQLDGHKESVLSFASAPKSEMFFSSSLDGGVLSWDADSCKVRKALRGHETLGAVTRLTMVDEVDMVFGIAGGGAVLGWDVGADTASVRLGSGVHHSKIVDICPVRTDPVRLLSMDTDGVAAVWDISAAFMGSAPLLTSVTIESMGAFTPRFAVITCPANVQMDNHNALKPAPVKPAERLRGASEALMQAVAEKQAQVAAALEAAAKARPGAVGKAKIQIAKVADKRKMIGNDADTIMHEEEMQRSRAAAANKAKAKSVEAHNAFHKLGVAGDMIVASARMFRYGSLSTSRSDAPVACKYNPVFGRFVTATGRDLATWSATSGRVADVFTGALPSDAMCFTFDDRKRKMFVGTAGGRVETLNLANGSTMKSGRLHAGAVADVVYIDEDRTLVASGWDGSLVVYDDEPQDALDPMRSVTYAHEGDVTALAVCSELLYILTGDKKGTIRAWDYQDLKLLATLVGHKGIVTSIACFGTIPLAASGDGDGQIIIWSTRGYSPPEGTAGHRFQAWARLYSFGNMIIHQEVYDPMARGGLLTGDGLGGVGGVRGKRQGKVVRHARQLTTRAPPDVPPTNVSLTTPSPGKCTGTLAPLSPSKASRTARVAPGTPVTYSQVKGMQSREERKAEYLAAREAAAPLTADGQITIAGMSEKAYKDILDSKVKLNALIEQILDDISAAKEEREGAANPNRKKRAFRINYDIGSDPRDEEARAIKARLKVREQRVDTAVTTLRAFVAQHGEMRWGLMAGDGEKEGELTGPRRFNNPVILAVGDDSGRIAVLDLLPLVRRLGVRPLKASETPRALASFSARRRSHRDEAGPVITDEGYFYSADDAKGPQDMSSLANVDIDLILALEKGRASNKCHAAVGLGQEVEAKVGRPGRRGSILAAVGAVALLKRVGGTAGGAVGGPVDVPLFAPPHLPPADIPGSGERGSVSLLLPIQPHTPLPARMLSPSADMLMANLQAAIDAAALASGQVQHEEVMKRAPTLVERRALIAAEGAQPDQDVVRPLIPLDGPRGIGIVAAMGRRSSIEARRIMRRASLEAGVSNAVSRETVEAIAGRPNVRTLVGLQAVNLPDGRGLLTVDESNDSRGKELSRQPGDIRELHVLPRAHAGAITSMHLVVAEHVTKCDAEVARSFLLDPIIEVALTPEAMAKKKASTGKDVSTKNVVPALAGYFLSTTGADARTLVWNLQEGCSAGQVGSTGEDDEDAAHGHPPSHPWLFPSPGPEVEALAREEANALLESVDAASDGAILGRRSSVATHLHMGASMASLPFSVFQSSMEGGSASVMGPPPTVGGGEGSMWWDGVSAVDEEGAGQATTTAPFTGGGAGSLASVMSYPRPGWTMEDEAMLAETIDGDSLDKVVRQSRLVEILPRRASKIAARRLQIGSRPGGSMIASTYLRDVCGPDPELVANGVLAPAQDEEDEDTMLPPEKLSEFDPAVLEETGGWRDPNTKAAKEAMLAGGTRSSAGQGQGQGLVRESMTDTTPSFATILASSNPAGMAAEALGPAAATVLGLTGYDTSAVMAKKAVGKAALGLKNTAGALKAAVEAAHAAPSRAPSRGRPGTTSSSLVSALPSSDPATSPSSASKARVLQLVAAELYSSAKQCGLRGDKLDTVELTERVTRLANGHAVALLGHAKPLDTATAIAIVTSVGGLKQAAPENTNKITNMYSNLQAEKVRNKLGGHRVGPGQQGEGTDGFMEEEKGVSADRKEGEGEMFTTPFPSLAHLDTSMGHSVVSVRRSPLRVAGKAAVAVVTTSPHVPGGVHPAASPVQAPSPARVARMNALIASMDGTAVAGAGGVAPAQSDGVKVGEVGTLAALSLSLHLTRLQEAAQVFSGKGSRSTGTGRRGTARSGLAASMGANSPPTSRTVAVPVATSPSAEAEPCAEPSPTAVASASSSSMPSHFGPYSSLEVLRVRRVFNSADSDGSGDVSLDELLAQPEWRRMYSTDGITQLYEAMDADASGRVTPSELFSVMFPKVDASTRRAMLYWSDPRRMARMAATAAPQAKPLSRNQKAEADAVFDTLDSDHDGYVAWSEVHGMMTDNALPPALVRERDKARAAGKPRPAPVVKEGGGPLSKAVESGPSRGSWNSADLAAVFHQYATHRPVHVAPVSASTPALAGPMHVGTADDAGEKDTDGQAEMAMDRNGFRLLWADIR